MFYTCENVWQAHRHLTSAILRVPQQRDAAHPTSLISRLNYAGCHSLLGVDRQLVLRPPEKSELFL
jgi:hypothetical protein